MSIAKQRRDSSDSPVTIVCLILDVLLIVASGSSNLPVLLLQPPADFPTLAMTKLVFYATECLLAEDCSAQSWKKVAVWSDSEEGCREQVVKHLMQSGYHKLSRSDAVPMAALAQIEFYEQEEEGEPPAKRAAIGYRPPPALSEGMPASASAGIVPAQASGTIYMRVNEFQASIDCVNRTLYSAQQAQRLSLAASKAFADEMSALTEVKNNLEAIKASAGLEL